MPPDMSLSEDHRARRRRIRLFLCDVDGVMTDGSILVGPGVKLILKTNGRWDAAVAKFAS